MIELIQLKPASFLYVSMKRAINKFDLWLIYETEFPPPKPPSVSLNPNQIINGASWN